MSIIGKAIIINSKKQTTLDGKSFSYTGNYTVKSASYYDLTGDYEVLALRTSGNLIFDSDVAADVFLVGGGAGGIHQLFKQTIYSSNGDKKVEDHGVGDAKGGAGHTNLLSSYNIVNNNLYNIIIGDKGEGLMGMGLSGTLMSSGASGGTTQLINNTSNETYEATGGSGGIIDFDNYTCTDGEGGSSTTAFEEEGAKLYGNVAEGDAINNTGDGAGSGWYNGGSGVILIRLS